ncbi:Tetratricopeptide repeat-containing protein [Zobellia uliginosa]|uniref:Tetratricopeptide repeat-containing protein n=1 Tax=Zobellia uliginosa TaxID=143224 RepID=A0ABY1KJ65_9FLAO|nr:tetratricopeptide repeat protein [Zobellia uliginosa]SIS40664.1 Tetratricopeptide repeat-containing protein [Zobellia uliginosa]
MYHKIRTTFFLFSFLAIPFLMVGQYSDDKGIDAVFVELNENLKTEQAKGGVKNIVLAHAELGYFCQENGVYIEALDQFNKALVLLENEVHDTLYVDLINRLGSIHLGLKNYEAAITHFEKCILEAQIIDAGYIVATAKSNLGTCYEKKGDYARALVCQNESLKMYLELDDSNGISLVNESIGSSYEDLEDFETAQGYFETALKYHSTLDKGRANILNNLGDVHRKTGALDQGLQFTLESLDVATRIGHTAEQASAHKDLSKTYYLMGEGERAYEELTIFLELDERNQSLYRSNQASALQVIYDTKEREAKIQQLLHEGEIDRAQKYLLVCAMATLGILGILWLLYVKRKKREGQKIADFEKRILEAELENKRMEEIGLQKEVYLKNAALSRYSLHLAQKNKMLSGLSHTLKNSLGRSNIDLKRKLREVVNEIDFSLSQEHEWDEFLLLFNEIHPDFIKQLHAKVLGPLSPAELRLSILLRLNLSSKEIAAILRLTPDSVRVSRYRLRKKLPIGPKEELSRFLLTF